jgi:hypothetical protein
MMRKICHWILKTMMVSVIVFTALSSPAYAQSAFRFASFGDGQNESANVTATAGQINSLNPAFAIFNGDLQNNGFATAEINPMITALGALYNKTFLVRGNHDDNNDSSAWQNFFTAAARPLPSGVTNYVGLNSGSTYLTYSFDYGNSRFIGLDVIGDADLLTAAQTTFIDTRLTDAENLGLTHAFIYFHGPIYCVESTHCNCSAANDGSCTPASIVSVINKHPIVSATFHGHEHILGWTHMGSARVPGLTREYEQFITSPAGGWTYNSYLYGGVSSPSRMDYAYPINSSSQGFAAIDVNGSSFTFNIYKVGSAAPVWSKTFTKPGTGTPVPTPTPGSVSPTPTKTPTPIASLTRLMKYYGVDRGNPITDANYATLASHAVKTVVVDTNINNPGEWPTIVSLATKYNFNVVIWPSDWNNHASNWPNCGWESPYLKNPGVGGDRIVNVKPLLDAIGTNPRVIGIVSAHEPMWSCISTIKEMTEIRTQLKDYVKNKFGRDIQVWNYVDNVTDLTNISDYTGGTDIGKIMDVAVTWQHCFGGAEGTCTAAKQKILNDRTAINNAGLEGKVDLLFLFQTFSMSGGYTMPTLTDMQTWDCQFIATNALDGFMYYTWGADWYSSDLDNHPELWPEMNRVYDSCINSSVPTNTPPGTSTPTPAKPPGDANNDGKVDETDYSIFFSNFGKTVTAGAIAGDFNNDGKVDGVDYVLWLSNFGI